MLILFNEGTFTWISSVQGKKDILNGMYCMVSAKPWFINGIKALYGRFLVSGLAYNMQYLQVCFSVYASVNICKVKTQGISK